MDILFQEEIEPLTERYSEKVAVLKKLPGHYNENDNAKEICHGEVHFWY